MYSLVTADIDQDNYQDIIIANAVDLKSHIKILINSGNGQLTDKDICRIDILINYILTADMNNDGKLDIIGKDRFKSRINILYNTDNGTFFDKINIPTNNGLNFIDVGDINGDNQWIF
jgi:hypothetical protein